MKDIYQVLRERELAVERVRSEIEALRSVLHLLVEEGDTPADDPAAPGGSECRDMFVPSKGNNRH